MPRFSSAAEVKCDRISGYWSLGIVLRGEDGDNDRDNSGTTSGYVGGRMMCSTNCATVRRGTLVGEVIRGSGLSVSGVTCIRNSVGDISTVRECW